MGCQKKIVAVSWTTHEKTFMHISRLSLTLVPSRANQTVHGYAG